MSPGPSMARKAVCVLLRLVFCAVIAHWIMPESSYAQTRGQEIVVGCAATSPTPYIAGACIGGAFTADEVGKCLSGSCFGANNDIVKAIRAIFGAGGSRKPSCGNFDLKPANPQSNYEVRAGRSWKLCSGYEVRFQNDGNLVVYNREGRAIWASNTDGRGATQFSIQGDGNAVIYAGHNPVWSTGTDGHWGAFLAIQEDGNVVLYDPSYRVLWKTDTNGK